MTNETTEWYNRPLKGYKITFEDGELQTLRAESLYQAGILEVEKHITWAENVKEAAYLALYTSLDLEHVLLDSYTDHLPITMLIQEFIPFEETPTPPIPYKAVLHKDLPMKIYALEREIDIKVNMLSFPFNTF